MREALLWRPALIKLKLNKSLQPTVIRYAGCRRLRQALDGIQRQLLRVSTGVTLVSPAIYYDVCFVRNVIEIASRRETACYLCCNHQGISPHAFMVDAIHAAARNAEKRQQFVARVVAARAEAVDSGGGYAAVDVHAYLRTKIYGLVCR